MKLLNVASILLAGAATVALTANSASAFTFTSGGTQVTGEGFKSSVEGAVTIDFNAGVAPTSGFATYSNLKSNSIVQGGVSGRYGNPAGDNSKYLTIAPTTSSVEGNTGFVSIQFAQAIDYFGLYWGSFDQYNTIKFFNGGRQVGSFHGGQIVSNPNGDWYSSGTNQFINFFAEVEKGEVFDRIELVATGIAFESDNHAYRVAQSVPEPAAMAGLVFVGGVASTLRRRNKKVAA